MNDPLPIAIRMAKRLYYRFWGARRGYGKPHSREAWDEQYRAGQWKYLNALEELDRYSVIVGYIRHFFEEAEILDVGCGHGRLLTLLHPSWFKRYMGVDLSQEAIDRARQIHVTGALFLREDFQRWTPPDLADVIVFNESLYYGHNPAAIVRRYLPALKLGGKIIVSMHVGGNHDIIWKKLDSALRRVHGVGLDTEPGQKWIVRIFEPISECLIT